jgi:prepilin-type N-terminal cleavage/methylation domain-containing protein
MTRGRAAARRGEAGFTLLELLVAMTLTAAIAAMAAGALRVGSMALARTTAVSEAAVEDRALRGFLGALLRDARPMRVNDGARNPPVLFEGGPDALLLAASLPSALAPPGPRLVLLRFEPAEDGIAALTLRSIPLGARRPSRAQVEAAPRETLAVGLADGRFAYAVEAGALADHWRGRARTPGHVAVTLRWADDRDWPVLRAAPRLRAEPDPRPRP